MVLIQSDSKCKLPHHFDAACALYGAIESGEYYRLTSFEEIQSGSMNNLLKLQRNAAVGSTDFMREVFKQLGKNNVRLPRNSNRYCETITLSEAHRRVAAGRKLFIKPVEIKLFSGLVLDGFKYSCLIGLPDNTLVMAYDPFTSKIESEWRIYVHKNEIVDARNYSGNFKLMPDFNYVEQVIKENKDDFPIAYTIDIGIMEEGLNEVLNDTWERQNVVIEFNDMWAIGNYGIPNDLYLRLLKDRYFQILNESN